MKILIIEDDKETVDTKAYRQKVLQRFYRLEQSRTTPGNGLDLSIATAIADLHEGTITLFDNKPGLKVVLSLWSR